MSKVIRRTAEEQERIRADKGMDLSMENKDQFNREFLIGDLLLDTVVEFPNNVALNFDKFCHDVKKNMENAVVNKSNLSNGVAAGIVNRTFQNSFSRDMLNGSELKINVARMSSNDNGNKFKYAY
jgi:hypothetical protein